MAFIAGGRASAGGVSFSQLSKSGLAHTPETAPYLAHAYNVDSLDFEKKIVTCRKSGLKHFIGEDNNYIAQMLDEGNGRFYLDLASAGNNTGTEFEGEFAQFSNTDNYIIMAVGWHGAGENNMIFRMGGGVGGSNHMRIIHTGYVNGAPDGYVGDTASDENGINVLGTSAARWPHPPTDPQDDPTAHFTDPHPTICVGMLDRANNLYHYRTWSTTLPAAKGGGEWTGGVQVPSFAIPANTGGFKMQAAVANQAGGRINSYAGHFYGMALWKFPDKYVPPNWYQAAVSMGHAWIDNRFDFYPF